ncbi:MAG: cadherin-like beta sandwich domain-containing protein [Peptococcia bacterium]|jgi:hypothetical protein
MRKGKRTFLKILLLAVLFTFVFMLTPQLVEAAETGADLRKLSIHFGTFSPEFKPEITNYTVTLDAIVRDSINFHIVAFDTNAKIEINGKNFGVGGESTVSLPFSPIYSIKVIGGDGSTKTYTLNMSRSKTNTTLTKIKELKVKSMISSPYLSLSPAFDPNITDYTVNLDEFTGERIILSIRTVDTNARVKINDEKECGGGVTASVPLKPKMVIEVIGRDGSRETYTLTMIPSATTVAADLKRLEVRSSLASPFKTFALSPAFDSDTTDYTLILDESVKEGVVLSLSPVDYNANIAINGVDYGTGGMSVGVLLTPKISIKVTGREGSTKTYTLTLSPSPTRTVAADLRKLEVKSGVSSQSLPLSPAFTAETTDYTVILDESVKEKVVLSLSTVDYKANIAINGVVHGKGDIMVDVPLEPQISIKVTGRDGSMKTYTLNLVGLTDATDTPTVTSPVTPETNTDSLSSNFDAIFYFLKLILQGLLIC